MASERAQTEPVEVERFPTPSTPTVESRALDVGARLVCVGGPDLGASFRLGPAVAVIGRGANATIRLTAGEVSRAHARIWRDGDLHFLEDLGATNRARINGAVVMAPTPLRYGDRIQLGATILVLAHHDELETRVQQLQHLESLTAAVSGMAHDFNNALQVILSAVDQLDEDLPPDSDGPRRSLADLKVATGSAVSLAKRLVKLGRGGAVPNERVELADVVSNVVAMANRVVDQSKVMISARVDRGFVVRGSRDELEQSLLNLCINARDAMPQGGKIELDATTLLLDPGAASARLLPTEGDYVELTVRDNGSGIDEATLKRIFEPFFTTKEPGKGTGLGLAMTHVITKKHGGTILVDSAVGRGTTFRLLLPLVPSPQVA
jgi:signal transduction histidine kinase